jgi:hypothetical protein
MDTQTQVAADLVALTAQVKKIGGEVVAKLAELEAALGAAGNASPEVVAALAALKVEVQAVDDLVADPIPDPAP